jgi:nucleoid DNA-binding protein
MNVRSLVDLVAEETGQTKKQTEATLEAAFQIIRGSVASGEAVRLTDFGIFEACPRSERRRHPRAADPVDPVREIRFLPAESFRKEVNHSS